ncbi:MAG TPA: hypothetical protein RMH99_11540 [Sandaracinaceae bacterium LLY-WYZ-13_1]|nr:hypothetical protein [Sandaracinaceae bacterium LLY-WYZ-13_1]
MSDTFVERVTEMARMLGWKDVDSGDGSTVRITIPIEGSEPVDVFVRPCGEMHGKEVLEFSSGGLRLPDDDTSKMPLLILALQRNADVIFGHWGLDETDDASTLRVFHSQITETMDPPELRGAVLAVADEYATLAGAFVDLLARQP